MAQYFHKKNLGLNMHLSNNLNNYLHFHNDVLNSSYLYELLMYHQSQKLLF